MEHSIERHYRLFLTGAFSGLIAIMTSLSVLAIFASVFPEQLQSFLKGPRWIAPLFYGGSVLLLFGIAYLSPHLIDFTFNLFFRHHLTVVIRGKSLGKESWKVWKTSLRRVFTLFGGGLLTAIQGAKMSFDWFQRGGMSASGQYIVGTLFIYLGTLWLAYHNFFVAVEFYMTEKIADLVAAKLASLEKESPDNGTINLDEEGFHLNDVYGEDFVAWSQIREVRGYKQGHGLNICLGLDFLTEGPVWWKVRDNMAGYYDMQSSLPRKLPGFDENWADKFLASEFPAEHYVIWQRKQSKP